MISKDLFMEDGRLHLSTRRFEKQAGLLYIVCAPLVVAAAIAGLSYFTRILARPASIPFMLVVLLLLYFLISYNNMVMKIIRNNKRRIFDKQDGKISINGKVLCRKDELRSVIIQPSSGAGGFGKSYTVGLEFQKSGEATSALPLSFFHVRDEARDIAKNLGKFYELEFSMKKSYLFSFFRKF